MVSRLQAHCPMLFFVMQELVHSFFTSWLPTGSHQQGTLEGNCKTEGRERTCPFHMLALSVSVALAWAHHLGSRRRFLFSRIFPPNILRNKFIVSFQSNGTTPSPIWVLTPHCFFLKLLSPNSSSFPCCCCILRGGFLQNYIRVTSVFPFHILRSLIWF